MAENGSVLTVGKEIRFAVVMYGGVSLAIYINGVAQELLKMCRATPKSKPDYQLESTEKIYRKIAYLLDNRELLDKVVDLINSDKSAEADTELENELAVNNLPRTRFVVDILTGTSAGGINAVFLSKALANNQSIKQLKDLWLNEDDISVLINDKKSVKDTDLPANGKAKSLLNSNRMYLKLLEAFEGMDDKKALVDEKSLFVDELDLFVPTTDFQGTVVPLRLFDSVVEEKRFRQVFHFQYDNNDVVRNDFEKVNNAMLAVAARATSSFPFAFEPMRVSQAYSVIDEKFPPTPKPSKKEYLKTSHTEFFPKIVDKFGNRIVWENRDLVDGGVLDNKPFGHAISVLAERKADLMVSRKLLYIEPSPEIIKNNNNEENDPPDVLENAIASLSSIPSYETIREDLERLLERNRLIERVTALIKNAEKDVFEYLMSDVARKEENPEAVKLGKNWEKLGLEDIVGEKGRAVLSYYRLRIVSLTDELARIVTQVLGVDENSEYFAVIRNLVWAWRKIEFSDYKPPEEAENKRTSLYFLRRFDLNYRLRRLRFVLLKASRLYYLNDDSDFSEELLFRGEMFQDIRKKNEKTSETKESDENALVEDNIRVSKKFVKKINADDVKTNSRSDFMYLKPSEVLSSVIKAGNSSTNQEGVKKQEGENYFNQINLAVKYFQVELNKVFLDLQKKSKQLLEPGSELVNHLKGIQANPELLKKLLESNEREINLDGKNVTSDNKNLLEIKQKNPELFIKIKDSAEELLKEYNVVFEDTRESIKKIFGTSLKKLPEDQHLGLRQVETEIFDAVRGYLKNYYDNFDEYDQISFPIYYQTQVGEAVKVDVMRISPDDGKLLNPDDARKRQKLAGESLFHFGAFLDRTWRWNDIFWGRLDGAERLISVLLPGKDYEKLREFLTRQAHDAIIEEELVLKNQTELRGLFGTALVNASTGMEIREAIGKITKLVTDDVVKNRLNAALQNCLPDSQNGKGNKEIYDFVKNQYEFEKKLEPKSLLRVISRSTKVVGDIFEGIAENKVQAGSQMRWIARLGQIFWGLVEVAAPNSFFNLLFNHWLVLLYFFEIVLIVGSTIFVKPEVQQFGIVSLVLTLITHLSVTTLNDLMSGGNFVRLLRYVAILLFIILAATGVLSFYAFFYDDNLWIRINDLKPTLIIYRSWQSLFPLSLIIVAFSSFIALKQAERPKIRTVGIITLVYVGVTVAFSVLFNYLVKGAYGIDGLGAVLSIEFIKPVDDLRLIAGELNGAVRHNLKNVILIDSLIFVPLYVGFLMFFSHLLIFRRSNWIIGKSNWYRNYLKKKESENENKNESEREKKNLDEKSFSERVKNKILNFSFLNLILVITMIFIVAAGIFDLIENFYSYWLLEMTAINPETWIASRIHNSALIKFGLITATTAILSLIFWKRSGWEIFTFGFLLAALVFGFSGLFKHQWISTFLLAQVFILLVVGIVFTWFPKEFKRE
jgi:patatin-related protein